MRSQVVLLDEFLITVVAVEWFFTSVKPFMHSQVVLLDELLVTVVAIEWLLSNELIGYPSGWIPYLSGGSWKVFQQCETFHALSGCPSGWVSCHSWIVISRAFIKWQNWMTSPRCASKFFCGVLIFYSCAVHISVTSYPPWWNFYCFYVVCDKIVPKGVRMGSPIYRCLTSSAVPGVPCLSAWSRVQVPGVPCF